MDNIFLIIVVILMALAVVDLVIGVANDAVNFLNSAIGSKAAPRYVIMTVASLGIMIGVMTSGGMMEIARNGIFNPSMFSFSDIMMLFLAVMISDIILLDVFNNMGLPTSTTVSLVFELMGAAVAVAIFVIARNDALTMSDISQFINTGKVLAIISGILMSIVIAFVCGSVVMYITRIIFTFRYQSKMRTFGALWCGFAVTSIIYFALFKGLKGTTIVPDQLHLMMDNNPMGLLFIIFLISTAVMLLFTLLKINIFKITVLAGTFSLALAFAGNDLVNFIGVPLAGLDSYKVAAATGDVNMMMGDLTKPVVANHLILLIAGVIMVVTLWTSKKAKAVTDTEVNLSRQDAGVERFGSTSLSRGLVRYAINMNKKYEKSVPTRVQTFIDTRFRPAPVNGDPKDRAPFDLMRATVNLTLASLLIALATSLKLPLSTTYVTFMVAMGSSLADRAWGRESAVYRVTGVLTVIAGWFLTALIAFTIAFVIAMILMWGGEISMVVLLSLVIVFLIHSARSFNRKRKIKEVEAQKIKDAHLTKADVVMVKLVDEVANNMEKVTHIYNQTLTGLFDEDRKLLKSMVQESEEIYAMAHERKHEMMPTLLKLQANEIESGHYYVQMVNYLDEVAKALLHITRPSFEHINNNHEGLTKEQIADLRLINVEVSKIYTRINQMLDHSDFEELDSIMHMRDALFDVLEECIKRQIRRVKAKPTTTRSSVLYLTIINETKTMLLQTRNLMKSQRSFVQKK